MNAALRSAGFSPLQRQVCNRMSAYFCATVYMGVGKTSRVWIEFRGLTGQALETHDPVRIHESFEQR